jgi:sugar/nucleoside kinase (ribokinase family)
VSSSFDVLCAGLIVADHVCAPIAAMPRAGTLVTTDRLEIMVGGCGANTAVNLAKLGVSAALSGRVGRDVLGHAVLELLTRDGVDCKHVDVSSVVQTSATLVVNVRGEDRRFIHDIGANAEFTGLEVSSELIAQAKIFYVGGFGLTRSLSGENVAQRFRTVRAAGGRTVLDVVVGDPQIARELLPTVLPETSLFLPNTDEAAILTGCSHPLEQARSFRQGGAETVIITAGAAGAYVASDEGEFHLPAYAVEQVDGTGGGDAFVAGVIYGLLKNANLQDCLRYGAAMGASCVKSVGATTGSFRRDELESFVASNPLELTSLGTLAR